MKDCNIVIIIMLEDLAGIKLNRWFVCATIKLQSANISYLHNNYYYTYSDPVPNRQFSISFGAQSPKLILANTF